MRLFKHETEGATAAVTALNDAATKKAPAALDDGKTKIDAATLVASLQKGLAIAGSDRRGRISMRWHLRRVWRASSCNHSPRLVRR